MMNHYSHLFCYQAFEILLQVPRYQVKDRIYEGKVGAERVNFLNVLMPCLCLPLLSLFTALLPLSVIMRVHKHKCAHACVTNS